MADPSSAAPATAALAVTVAAPDFPGVTAAATVVVVLVTAPPTSLATVVVALTAEAPAVLVAFTAAQQQNKKQDTNLQENATKATPGKPHKTQAAHMGCHECPLRLLSVFAVSMLVCKRTYYSSWLFDQSRKSYSSWLAYAHVPLLLNAHSNRAAATDAEVNDAADQAA
jgi:hypothetical protein